MKVGSSFGGLVKEARKTKCSVVQFGRTSQYLLRFDQLSNIKLATFFLEPELYYSMYKPSKQLLPCSVHLTFKLSEGHSFVPGGLVLWRGGRGKSEGAGHQKMKQGSTGCIQVHCAIAPQRRLRREKETFFLEKNALSTC